MKKSTKIWIVTAAFLVSVGSVVFAVAMSKLGWDFTKLSTVNYETNVYEITDDFAGITLNTDIADIDFALSNDGKCSVKCREEEKAKHSVTVEDGTLKIVMNDKKRWYEHIEINFASPKITVYLPKTAYESLVIKGNTCHVEIPKSFTFTNADITLTTGETDFFAKVSEILKIKATTGDICVENISVGSVKLSVSTGEVSVENVNCAEDFKVGVSTGEVFLDGVACKSVISDGSTGDITLKNVIAAEKISLKRSTGNVKFNGCDAVDIAIKTDTGDVKGSLLSEKVFITQTDTGDVEVPKTAAGGRCEITTDTGNIKISLQ